MVDSLVHISNIAQMEHRLPRSGDGTLWEGDELTVRFLLEEGKLNLCLRLMHEFCRRMEGLLQAPERYAAFLAETAAAAELPDTGTLEQRLLTFEQGMGVLLRCAFEHVEAVQTTDLPELFQHAAEVLAAASRRPPEAVSLDRTQPAMVLRYTSAVLARIEHVGEDRVMPYVREHGLMGLVVGHLHTHAHALKPDDLLAGATFLARAIDTEAFEDGRGQFLDAEATGLLRDFRGLFLGELTAEHEQRRLLRPLLDVVTRAGG